MLNPLEQPWLLIICSVIILIAVLIFRKKAPERFRLWYWCIPLLVFAMSFGLDYYIATDREKIENLIQVINKTAETENCELLAPYIAEDYSDARHRSKNILLNNCRARLSEPLISKSVSKLQKLTFENGRTAAETVFTMRLVFDPESKIFQYQRIMLLKFELTLKRSPNGKWLIKTGELLEVNHREADWQDIFR